MIASILGAGAMGSAMTQRLRECGFEVRVWDRTRAHADALSGSGAHAFGDVVEAVRGADAVITMLSDGAAVNATMEQALPAMRSGAVWVQMSTIGLEATAQAIALAQRRTDVAFVDAPVSGSTGPARAGTLVILASGPQSTVAMLAPLFTALAHKTVWLGDAGAGSRMKLVLNAWLAMLVEGTAEFAALATGFGVRLDRVAECLHGGPLDAPLVQSKLAKIAANAFESEFSLANAAKDVRLALEAAGRDGDGPALPLLETLDRAWQRPLADGYGQRDVSAVYLALQQSAAT